MMRGDEYETPTLEEALRAWDRYENTPSLLVGDNLWVYGSHRALSRAQFYILADSSHPVERADTNKYLANELKLSEAMVKALREQVAYLQDEVQAYKRSHRKK
jgi:hypothetical protein